VHELGFLSLYSRSAIMNDLGVQFNVTSRLGQDTAHQKLTSL